MAATATQESVFAAADALSDAQQKVTLLTVRNFLGGGGLSTIQKYLDQWKQRQAEQRVPVVEVPDQVVEQALAAARAIWRTAQTETSREIARVREDTTAEVAEMQEELGEAHLLIQQQEAELKEQQQALASQDAAMQALRAERDEAQMQVRLAEDRASAAAERAADLQGRLDSQAAQLLTLAQLQGAHTALERQLAEQNETIKRLTAGRPSKGGKGGAASEGENQS